ncbi:MAG: hypothetical protein ABSG08_11965 [Terriglobales bacterium]
MTFSNYRKIAQFLFVTIGCLGGMGIASTQQEKRPFAVVDDIGFVYFGDLYGGAAAVEFSPDGNYFAVDSERGHLDLNSVEDSLAFYGSQDVEDFLKSSNDSQPPSPVWVVNRSAKKGAVISGWRWLADSSGIAFLEPTEDGTPRLFLADFHKKTIEPLTSETEAVMAFDIQDRKHYVYTVADPAGQEGKNAEREAASVVGTGRSLFELILTDNPITARIAPSNISLWAVVGGRPFKVETNGTPLPNFGSFALSPDGRSLVTTQPVLDVPSAWETLYPPPPSPPCAVSPCTNRIHAGHYDSQSSHVQQYVRIDLQTGSIQSLADAPIAQGAGWIAYGNPSWSNDGREILLPNTFLKSKVNAPSRPCVAVLDVSSGTSTCVEVLKAHKTTEIVEEGYHVIRGARFTDDTGRVMVAFNNHEDLSPRTTEYQRTNDIWQVVREISGKFPAEHNGLELSVKQGLNDPPMLVATDGQTSRVLWDPNPQFKGIELGRASVYTYKDKQGREWKAGLYKPSNYKPGQRYPLVIQTHGFSASLFIPSGGFSTAFAARALAAAGIVVLHVSDDDGCPVVTRDEGACAVSDYEAAASQLVSEGLVDPQKIGIIGFSRTCYYVMETLTTSSFLHLKAASITDGVMFDYFSYIQNPDRMSGEADRVIGAPPFGDGLQLWLKRSPGFNLNKVAAPLLVVGEGPLSLLSMWQPYAGLRFLKKPVDLIMLNTREHVLTNPSVRMASQGGSVDWFRFWLQGYEDPDPAKAYQYKRWHDLRKLQDGGRE